MTPAVTDRFGAARAALHRIRVPASIWAATAVVLVVAQHVSNRVTREPGYRLTSWAGLHRYLDGWRQFDGVEYIKIAEHGYWYRPGERSPIVWFPLYPTLLRWATGVIEDPMLAGIVLSALAGLVAVVLYWHWLGVKGIEERRRIVPFLALLFYPYAWYLYGPVHSDSLFLALLVGACLLVEKDRYVLAGLVGALATATRPTGMAVIPGLVALGLQHAGVFYVKETATGIVARFRIPLGFDRSRLTPRVLAPGLSVLGLGGYMLYLGLRFGDPIAFINNQRVYHPGGLPLLKRAFAVAWRDATDWTHPLTLTGQAICVVTAICCVPFVGRRFGWGYGVFLAALVAIPTFSTEDFMGSGRYLIAAFPAWALLGERLADRPAAARVVVPLMALVILGLNMGYSRSWYLT